MSSTEIAKNRTQAVIQKMKEKKYDPIDSLIDIARDDRVALEDRIGIHKFLTKFAYPTVKNVQIDAQVKSDLVVHVKEFKKPATIIEMEPQRNERNITGQGQPIQLEGNGINLQTIGRVGGHPDIIAD